VDFFAVSGGLQNSPCHGYGRNTVHPSSGQTSDKKNGKRERTSSVQNHTSGKDVRPFKPEANKVQQVLS